MRALVKSVPRAYVVERDPQVVPTAAERLEELRQAVEQFGGERAMISSAWRCVVHARADASRRVDVSFFDPSNTRFRSPNQVFAALGLFAN